MIHPAGRQDRLHYLFEKAEPFRHVVIDDFMGTAIAERPLWEWRS